MVELRALRPDSSLSPNLTIWIGPNFLSELDVLSGFKAVKHERVR